MSRASYFRFLKLTRFYKPAHVRPLYRAVVSLNARRIVEIGVGDTSRASDMISLALRSENDKPVRYTGIDLFEARSANDALSLKEAHTALHSEDYDVRLVPGEPLMALKRSANELRGTDLIVVSSYITQAALDAARHLLPRMLHKDSQVWIEKDKGFEVFVAADLTGIARRAA